MYFSEKKKKNESETERCHIFSVIMAILRLSTSNKCRRRRPGESHALLSFSWMRTWPQTLERQDAVNFKVKNQSQASMVVQW